MNQRLWSRILLYASGLFAIAAIILLVVNLVSSGAHRALLPGGMACCALAGVLRLIWQRVR